MMITGSFLNWDELCLGFQMNNGEDDFGELHITTIGFLIFSIDVVIYKK